jgi:DNA (cytosine-5)-methyltransferase 1
VKAIDLFAGAGGSSEGARQAGARVIWAANHWPLAVAVHARNHPDTDHVCQDLHQCDWSRAPACDLVLASPACQGHSRAASTGGVGRRGSSPKHDADRSTAWAVVSCLESTRAPLAVVENVIELQRWTLYPSWLDALSRLGYSAAEHFVDASHFGVAQRRRRLFVVLARARQPLWLDLPRELDMGPMPLSQVRDRSADASGWKLVADLPGGPNGAKERILRAVSRCGNECAVNYVTDDVGTPLTAPGTTITTCHQRAWIRLGARGLERRMWTSKEYARAMGFADSYQLTGRVGDDCRLLGNAVCPPVMRAIVTELMVRG